MIVHHHFGAVLLVAVVLASGCGRSSSAPGDERQIAPPAPGAIVYSVHEDAFLLAYEQGLLVDDRGAVNLTETDHRVVRAVSSDGRVIVLGDYHGQGGGLYLRRRTRTGSSRTLGLTGERDAPVAVCGADSAVYVDGTRLMRWRVGASAPHPMTASLTPERLACSATGRIAALAHDGTLMVGDASNGLSVIGGGRYTDTAWSRTGWLAACTASGDAQPGRVVLIGDSSVERRPLARIGSGCALGWSPDGRHIAATSDTGQMVIACTCSETPRTLVAAEALGDPTWSPDGTAIAYSGFLELRAVTYPAGRSVLIADEPSSVIAWLDPPASLRSQQLADRYPCCGP